jgi:hypothetical protein
MKANVVHALTAVGAFALATVIGYAVQPAEAAPIVPQACAVQAAPPAPSTHTPLVREHRIAI